MFGPKIKIDKGLYERLEKAAGKAGYATTDEFIIHVLAREVSQLERGQDDEEVRKQLRGLGYIE